jgi:probable DNA repair protein
MGSLPGVEIDAWLRQGGMVVTANERAARALVSHFNQARRAEGLKAWTAPNIQDWKSFVRSAWTSRSVDGRLLLNRTQEEAIWAGLVAADSRLTALLEGPRFRLAALAMEAHELLCSHEPRLLRATARAGWQHDAAEFSRWLTEFDEACRAGGLLSAARLPIELLQLLANPASEHGRFNRPPLLLAGFDRILPVQRAVFDAWGPYQEAGLSQRASEVQFHEATHEQTELVACSLWCRRRLREIPGCRVLVVTQDATTRRGEIERAFLEHSASTSSLPFEFSLGIPLIRTALPRAAHLLLRWLDGPIEEHELDWLFSTGFAAANPAESSALQAHMHSLRQRGLQQPDWTVQAFIQAGFRNANSRPFTAEISFKAWSGRITDAQRRVKTFARLAQSPLDWAELIPRILEGLEFGASQPLSSAEFQAFRQWQKAIETAGSLGFDGRRMDGKEFLSVLARTLDETLFAAESHGAPILIAGPAESAGLTADAIWFLGATEDAWPARGTTHPLLPPEVQRESRMPHATPQLDWDLAQAISVRVLASAPEVHFSFAKQVEGAEMRPSRLIAQLAGAPQPMPVELTIPCRREPLTISVEDSSCIPYSPGKVPGGSRVLTFQSQCAFKAFATARLGAEGWDSAETGLTPAQRGQLLHAILHAVWAGPPDGIRTHADLMTMTDLKSFVSAHIFRVFETKLPSSLIERLPARYLELEKRRLHRLVMAWLEYEASRVPFEVLKTEAARSIALAGLNFDLRLDRLDRLADGSVLVIDYKSGDVSPKSWELPRPDDVQLPLYAGFALDEQQHLGGLVFAKLRPGDLGFAGHVGAPTQTLLPGLKSTSALAKNRLEAEQLIAWKENIEQLARDFLAGRAEVDPRDAPETCKRCGLQTICRIQENLALVEFEDEPESSARESNAKGADE